MSGFLEESNVPTHFMPSNVMIAVIVTSGLGIAIIILTTVLVGAFVYYCKKKKASEMVHSQSQPAALKLSIPVREASKFFVVESSSEHSKTDPLLRGKRENKISTLQFLFPSLRRKQTQPDLQAISKPIVLDMESNPNYHKLATNKDGTDTPDSSSSPMLIVSSECAVNTEKEKEICRESEDECTDIPSFHTRSVDNSSTSFLLSPTPPARCESLISSYSKSSSSSENQKFLPRAQSENQIGRQNECDLYGPIYSELNNRLSTSVVKIKAVSATNVNLIKNLGMGQFGLVHLGETVGLSEKDLKIGSSNDRTKTLEVAVKVLRPNPPHGEKVAFEREVKYMSHFKHENVVRLLAVCWEGQQFILMEYMRHGDLQNFLQQYDLIGDTDHNAIPHLKLVQMTTQIASAMMYLASCKFIHRDLATRNCLVGDNFVVKVADFGLSRNLYDSCYYRFQGSAMLPIRWMANECFYGRFSEKTDVYAFGVTMWEIFTLCKEKPYSHKSDQQLVVEILRNTRTILEKPKYCDQQVYRVMEQCMIPEAETRLDFQQVFNKLSQINVQ